MCTKYGSTEDVDAKRGTTVHLVMEGATMPVQPLIPKQNKAAKENSLIVIPENLKTFPTDTEEVRGCYSPRARILRK